MQGYNQSEESAHWTSIGIRKCRKGTNNFVDTKFVPAREFRILFSQHDARVSAVADEYLSSLDESDRRRGAGGGGQPGGGGAPPGLVGPHGRLGGEEALADGAEDQAVVVGPEVPLAGDVVHQVLLGEQSGLQRRKLFFNIFQRRI